MVKCRQTLYPRRFGVTRSGTKYWAEPCASPGGQHVRRTWYNRRQRGEETNQVCRRQQERGDVHLEILVTTEELLAKAEEIHNFTGRLKQQLESIETEVHTTSGFWKGDGNAAFIRHYNNSREQADIIVWRFQEHVTDLREMAGVYEATEKKIVELTETLPGDVL